jgi:hypothetical protein
MGQNELAIGEVRMSFTGGKAQAERTERIARMTFDHVHRLMDTTLRNMNESIEINYMNVGPIGVSFDSMDDETIAAESATRIYRSVLQSI